MNASPALATQDFERFLRLNASQELGASDARSLARREVLAQVAQLLTDASAEPLPQVPKLLGQAFAAFGWDWNGFYGLRADGNLHLSFAHGPPVCTPLEPSGGALSSGMCFDSLALNQTLAAYDTSAWPGYVSCDATSHLGTQASIVVPLRDPAGQPMAKYFLAWSAGVKCI